MTDITGAGGTHTPTLVTLYEANAEARTYVETLLDGTVSFQLMHAGPRSGIIEALFANSQSDAYALAAELGEAQVLELEDDDLPLLDMEFVVTGEIQVRQDESRKHWTVRFGFVEVPA